MKKRNLPSILLLCIWALSACQGTPIPPTAIPPTDTPIPTDTPQPTSTVVPSPTTLTYPDVLNESFSNVYVLYKDDFDYKGPSQAPEGWVSKLNGATMSTTRDDNFRIGTRTNSQGDVFYYAREAIHPGEGVSFSFKYTGTKNTFTLGLDNIDPTGKFVEPRQTGYHSFAMQMNGQSFSAHVIKDAYLQDDPFKGDLKLTENTWYGAVIAIDADKNYFIKVWDLNAPEHQLSYVRSLPDASYTYLFISWIGAERVLWMDEFTIFRFDALVQ